jgi:hypothetical protein
MSVSGQGKLSRGVSKLQLLRRTDREADTSRCGLLSDRTGTVRKPLEGTGAVTVPR